MAASEETIKKYIGKRYGRLVVLEFTRHDKGVHRFYLCRCDCGKIKEYRIGALQQTKGGGTKSCGCLWLERTKASSKGNTYTRLPFGESAKRNILKNYKLGAKNRGLEFKLTDDEFFSLTKGDCFYCGRPPSTKKEIKLHYGYYMYNGVDRVDNEKGYTKENCVPSCGSCNFKKKAIPIAMVKKIYEFIFNRETVPSPQIKTEPSRLSAAAQDPEDQSSVR